MNGFLKQLLRVLPAAAFSALSAFCGVGLAWRMVSGEWLASWHIPGAGAREAPVAASMPVLALLVAGGVAGAIVGLVCSLRLLILDGGDTNRGVMKLYLGVPISILFWLAPLLRWLGQIVGQNADVYATIAVMLVVFVLSLILYDHIPQKLLIPLGVVAWMLTLALGWCWFNGPGTLRDD
jgi:hypothetical protein